MNAETKREVRFSGASDPAMGVEEDASYRTLSVMAVLSLLVGLAAPLCLVAPLLFTIPLVGIVLALAAMVRIAGSDGAMIGRGAALLGLGLCIGSMFGAYTRTVVTDRMLSQQAREVGMQWVALLQAGAGQQAFELTVSHAQGPPPKPPVNLPDQQEAAREDPLGHFLAEPVAAYLMGAGRTAHVQFDQDLASWYESAGVFRIAQLYRVDDPGGSASQSAPTLRLTLQRTRTSSLAPARWLIHSYQSDDLPKTPAGA